VSVRGLRQALVGGSGQQHGAQRSSDGVGGGGRERSGSLSVHGRRRKAPWPHRGVLRGDNGDSASHVGGGESVGASQRNGGGGRATSARSVFGAHLLGRKLAGGLGCFLALAAHTVGWAGTALLGPAQQAFSLISKFQKNSNDQLQKYQTVPSRSPKVSKILKALDFSTKNNFLQWPNFKFPLEFKL
jgi:hypothetical protein